MIRIGYQGTKNPICTALRALLVLIALITVVGPIPVLADSVSGHANMPIGVAGSSIAVTSPNGGEVWSSGTPQVITWDSSGVTGVKILVSWDGGTSWKVITSLARSSGSYNWKVSGPGTASARVKVISLYTKASDTSDADFTIIPGMTVAAPNGSESWIAGTQRTIRWAARDLTGNVSIELSRDGGSSWEVLVESMRNTGARNWTVSGPGTSRARIKISGVSIPEAYDVSDADFTIVAPSIAVTSPNGGESFKAGSIETVAWTSSGVSGKVRLMISRDGGSTWTHVTTLVSNAGNYDWTVDGPATTQARFKVIGLDTEAYDISDASFTITDPTIKVTSPNGGESYLPDSLLTITWSSSQVSGNVDIELSRDSGNTWDILATSIADTGSYNWTVTTPATTDARIKVTGSDAYDISDSDFAITFPIITVTYPNGGVTLQLGGMQTITWTSAFVVGDVSIQVSRDGGTSWNSIETVANTSSYDWTVTGPSTATARIRVASASDPSVSDSSDENSIIGSPAITVTAPDGGETYTVGTTLPIAWSASDFFGTVSIQLSRDSGTGWSDLATSIANTGSYDWAVTGPRTTEARIRVSSDSDPSIFDDSGADFTIAEPQITVTSPNGGQIWAVGATETITWESADVSGNVIISLSRDSGSTWETLATVTDDGSYDWLVTGPTAQALVQIATATSAAVSDTSDTEFSIIQSALEIVSPDGGEVWGIGSPQTITWTSADAGTEVTIEISRDGGSTWEEIVSSIPDMGSYQWSVTGPTTTAALVKVTTQAEESVSDTSNAVFSIVPSSITVTSPDGGEIWMAGQSRTIAWTAAATAGNVRIQISRDGGGTFSEIAVTADSGSYVWTVDGPRTTDARIRIVSDNDDTLFDDSNNNFTILVPSITMTSPNGGESWKVGETETVTWNSTDVTGNVVISLSRNEGLSWERLAIVADTGSYDWLVTAPRSTKGRIKVVSSTLLVEDSSDADFSIGQPSITVTTPNGGESWGVGAARMITWKSVDIESDVTIKLSRDGGATWETVAVAITDTGSYDWNVSGPATAQALIWIASAADASVFDRSNKSFTIIKPTITVSAPKGGEAWVIGSKQTIRWTSTGVPGNVDIYVSRDDGTTWEAAIGSGVEAAKRVYQWTVTGPNTSAARFKVVSSDDDIVFGISLAKTRIGSSIILTSPNGGETWYTGSKRTVTWSSTFLRGNVKIEVSRDAGTTYTTLATVRNGTTGGKYVWTITGPSTANARVRVQSVSDGTVIDGSDADFNVATPSITVTSPNGGESWAVGSSQSITWTSAGVTGMVKIELSRNGGTTWTAIVPSTANTGSRVWKVTGTGTTQARVRVSSVSTPAVNDASDSDFAITGPPPPSISVTSPNGGETWAVGSSQSITWTSTGVTGMVKIELSRNGGTTWTTIVPSTANTGSKVWKVTGTGTTQARVRVTSASTSSATDTSNANFTIAIPEVWNTYSNTNTVQSLAVDGTKVWVGTTGGLLLANPVNQTYVKYVSSNSGLVGNRVKAIAIDGSGNKLFGTDAGVSKFDGTTWTTYTTANGLASNYVYAVAIDGAGNKWFGTIGGGVSKFDGTTWTTYTTANSGLASNLVTAIAVDSAGNKWFGTGGGVSRFGPGTPDPPPSPKPLIVYVPPKPQLWYVQQEPTYPLQDAVFVDSLNGWAVGGGGRRNDGATILHTSDGGTSWTPQASGFKGWLYGVDFVDSNIGWAVGGGTIIHTSNGGGTWSSQLLSGESLYGLDFVDDSQGWVVGASGTIMHTSNGGVNWSAQVSGTSVRLNGVQFVDAANGWAVGDGGAILHTSDGGEHWTSQTSGSTTEFKRVRFVDSTTGWAVGHSVVHTSDGGLTWSTQIGGGLQWLQGAYFVDALHGWVSGWWGDIRHTSDGGATWVGQSSSTVAPLLAIQFADASHGWAMGEGGVVVHTSDGGETWAAQMPQLPTVDGLDFPDSTHGWAVGSGAIMHTANGGDSWTIQLKNRILGAVDFVDASNGWATGWYSIVHTSDGGLTWTDQKASGAKGTLTGVKFVNALTGWVVGDSGVILKTTNGGSTWTTQTSGTTLNLTSVAAPTATQAWAVGGAAKGIILHTANGGAGWDIQTIPGAPELWGVTFTDTENGWAVGDGGTILHTSDGGATWKAQTSGVFGRLRNVSFSDTLHGWVVGHQGVLLSTVDGGAHWVAQKSGTQADLISVATNGAANAWAAGQFGIVLHTSELAEGILAPQQAVQRLDAGAKAAALVKIEGTASATALPAGQRRTPRHQAWRSTGRRSERSGPGRGPT